MCIRDRQYAAQCWCDPETSDRVMDTQLAEAVAKRIAAWMDTAAQAQHIVDYYRSLVVRCGNALGDAARTADAVSYTHLRAHENVLDLACRLLLEKKNSNVKST